jgi:hypothetical protein
VANLIDSAFETAADVADAARSYLASEPGRRVRRTAATAVIIAAPLLSELPVFRRTPFGRLVRTAAVGTLIVKGAEWIRDWEPHRVPDRWDLGPAPSSPDSGRAPGYRRP